MHKHYPEETVRVLLQSDQVSEKTRQVLTDRLTASAESPRFFSSQELELLRAICNRLIPQDNRSESIDVAGGIDKRLAQHGSDGWRYDTMPADGDAYKQGLAGIEETAHVLFGQPFQQLAEAQQDELLSQIQRAEAPGTIWSTMPANRFFEELLTEAAHNFYSHPLAQEEIGYVGMADVPGWQRIGLNQLESREPRIVNE
ncbi:hypothetical protein GCM10027592_04780 [Spirosoma flavus]